MFGAREKRVVKGVDIEKIKSREGRHDRERGGMAVRELIMKKRGLCKIEMGILEGK